MKKLLSSSRFALGSVLLIWFLVRLYPMTHVEPLTFTEVGAARGLLHYGFFESRGARLGVGYWAGTLPHPETYRYMHYPLPMFWVLTFVYYLSGEYGVLAFVLLLKLAACALVFKILDRNFERFAAWFGAVLFAVAPCAIILDCDADLVAAGAVFWPFAIYLLMRRPMESAATRWTAALIAFVAGQVSWFTLTVIPGLMAFCETWTRPPGDTVKALLKNKTALALLLGGVVSFAAFLAQVVIYDPDIHQLLPFIRTRMGATDSSAMPRGQLLTLFPLRTFLFVGAGLMAGLLAGLRWAGRRRTSLVMAATVYLPSFVVAALVLPQYFYTENMVYGSLLFPAAVLTSLAVQEHRRVLPWLLAVLAVPGLIYGQLYFAVPMISPAARTVAKFLAGHTQRTDVVLTNLKPANPPFKSSDVFAGKAVLVVADRAIFFNFERLEDLNRIPIIMKSNAAPMVMLVCKSRPLDPLLLDKLHRDARLETTATISLPSSQLNAVEKLRAFIWHKIMRKAKAPSAATGGEAQACDFELYRFEKSPTP
jgi:hypothetical protein